METPLSTKRITRSQTKAAAAAATINSSVPMLRKNNEQVVVEESKQRNNNGGKSDRSALIDITNDSPIVGLAMGSCLKTPSSFSKKKDLPKMRMITTTPGSGEALLRREVKTLLLLQKVEEEAEGSKLSFDRLFLHLEDPVSSSSRARRPQEAMMMNNNNNSTPHLFFNLPTKSDNKSNNKSNGSGDHIKGNSLIPSQVETDQFPQMVERIDGGLKQKSLEKSLITRSLLFDFSEKSSSSVDETYSSSSSSSSSSSIYSSVGSVSSQVLESSDENDDGVWSIRVNKKSTSIQSKEEEKEYYGEESEGGGGGLMIDELCEGVMKISVANEKRWRMIGSEFEGKHKRFVYNSEDEIEGEEEDDVVGMRTRRQRRKSPLHLKGLPTPAGKHLRFSNEDIC